MKTDIVFENLKVGQKLYSIQYGEVEVFKIGREDFTYPIEVNFINSEGYKGKSYFTKDGKHTRYHQFPSLFLTNPFENLNQERVIEVFDTDWGWVRRVCIKTVGTIAVCLKDAKTIEESKSATKTISYSKWRELQPEQPAAEQPKEITIDGVEYVLTPKTK